MKFLNQNCILQTVGFDFLTLYNQDSRRFYVFKLPQIELLKSFAIENINLLSLCDDKVATLSFLKAPSQEEQEQKLPMVILNN